jgi:hypothetical protein
MACYINEFRPLAQTPAGRNAIEQHKLPPFIDASCRREPDLESKFPSITALCRGEHFAPRLQVGDVVAYMTKAFVYPPTTASARRLVAVLRVKESWTSHEQAAEWYREQGSLPPRNCMVRCSTPLPLDFTDKYNPDWRDWEAHYWRVARRHGNFHACDKMFCELVDPPRLTNQQLLEWFGCIPDTRELPPLPPQDFAKLLCWLAEQPTAAAKRQRLEALFHSMLHRNFKARV